jgi:fatty-acyl-CoA synthase
MAGYWNQPDITAETITADGWLHTGDAACRDEDGYFYAVGRVKDALQLGDETVFPPEIENVLLQHPAVADCAVLGIGERASGHEVAACVVLKPDISCTEADLLEFGEAHLPEHKRPRMVRFVTEIPRNANEKIVRTGLRHLFDT